MNKKAIAGDALIIVISLIVIATLGVASFSMFGLDLFGESVEQVIKEVEYKGEVDEILFNFLKQDANYKGLNNLGLILFNVHNKLDFEIINNKLNENLDIETCWWILVVKEDKAINLFNKIGCEKQDMVHTKYKRTKLKVPDFKNDLSIELGVEHE